MILTHPSDIAQTTPTGGAIARIVSSSYALGDIQYCMLLKRGINHVYELRFGNGQRAVARLCADRSRGQPNIDYESAFLAHVKAAGVPVANVLMSRQEAPAVEVALPEGTRMLMLFEYLDGDLPGESLPDIEATGRGLAQLHEAGQNYSGPGSRYMLELPQLLHASFESLVSIPTIDDALRVDFSGIVQRLDARISSMSGLTRVNCHGDCHGGNNLVADGPDGTRVASFFDFDDAGPGLLAYELGVYLWNMLLGHGGGELDAEAHERWSRFISSYRSIRPIESADFEAIAACVSVRQFWQMAEYANLMKIWGTQAMTTKWLRGQVRLLTAWEALKTPD